MDRVEDRQAGFRKRRHERCVDPTRRFACETVHSEAKARDRPHGIVPREVDLGGSRAGEGRRFVRQVSSSTTPSPHSALAIFLLMYSPSCQYSETSSELTASYARPRAASTSATTSLKRASLSKPAGSAVRRSIVSAPLRLSWSSPAGPAEPVAAASVVLAMLSARGHKLGKGRGAENRNGRGGGQLGGGDKGDRTLPRRSDFMTSHVALQSSW